MKRGRLFILLLVAVLISLFFILDLGGYFSLESLKANRSYLEQFYQKHRVLSISVFVLIYVVQTSLSLPGAAVMTIAGGAVFGVFTGAVAANIGATMGATCSFIMTRYLFHDMVQKRFGPRLGSLNRELEKSGINYLLFLRLVPIFPFFLINLAAGLTKMPLRTFLIGTMIGIIPGGLVFSNAGASLAAIETISQIASTRVLGSFALLGLFALVPVLYQKISQRKKPAP